MGWLVALVAPQLSRSLGMAGTLLVLAGGGLYTLGVPFYAWRSLPHHHGIWHVFVLVGSLSHFLAVALCVVPQMR
jgi:hemolysin III